MAGELTGKGPLKPAWQNTTPEPIQEQKSGGGVTSGERGGNKHNPDCEKQKSKAKRKDDG